MAELELGPLRFGIVGAGRLGCVLGLALQARGFQLTAASSRSERGRSEASHRLQVPVFADPAQTALESDVLLLCVPDGAVAEIATQLAEALPDVSQLRVVHTSGAVPNAALAPLAERGADTLGVHPLQTITARSTPADLRGAAAAVTADSVPLATFGHALCHALELHPFDLPDEARPLYHAAAAIAANFTVTLQGAVRDVARAAHVHDGVARHAFTALARAALDRVEFEGPEEALTGPVPRGDTETIALHLAALDAALPAVGDLYRPLAHATVRLSLNAGQIDIDTAARLDTQIAYRTPHAGPND